MLILGLPYHLYLCLLSLNGYFLLLILLHLMPLYTLRLILAYLTTIFVLYFIILVNLFLIQRSTLFLLLLCILQYLLVFLYSFTHLCDCFCRLAALILLLVLHSLTIFFNASSRLSVPLRFIFKWLHPMIQRLIVFILCLLLHYQILRRMRVLVYLIQSMSNVKTGLPSYALHILKGDLLCFCFNLCQWLLILEWSGLEGVDGLFDQSDIPLSFYSASLMGSGLGEGSYHAGTHTATKTNVSMSTTSSMPLCILSVWTQRSVRNVLFWLLSLLTWRFYLFPPCFVLLFLMGRGSLLLYLIVEQYQISSPSQTDEAPTALAKKQRQFGRCTYLLIRIPVHEPALHVHHHPSQKLTQRSRLSSMPPLSLIRRVVQLTVSDAA